MTDIDDTPPTLGTCDLCGWQFMFPTVFAKEKGVDKHHERWHGDLASQTDEVCDRLWIERGDERAKVVKAVEAVALLNGGEVDWNTVRGLIDGEVSSGVPGAVVNVLQRQGRLVFVREVQSTDRKSRNTNKKSRVYQLVADDRSQTA
jgi:hypothetical protein